jgi:hypothetical protein
VKLNDANVKFMDYRNLSTLLHSYYFCLEKYWRNAELKFELRGVKKHKNISQTIDCHLICPGFLFFYFLIDRDMNQWLKV